MNESVFEFISMNLSDIVTVGSGFGFLLTGISALLGYVISKVQSFID